MIAWLKRVRHDIAVKQARLSGHPTSVSCRDCWNADIATVKQGFDTTHCTCRNCGCSWNVSGHTPVPPEI